MKSVDDILTEQEVLNLFGVKKPTLDNLRYEHGLPFCRVTRTARLYLMEDIFMFLEQQRVVSEPK
jgi:hypothetical protein